MKIIGLCGPSGAGKGEVALCLLEYGVKHIDGDVLSRQVAKGECLKQIANEFGEKVITAENTLDRKALGDIVFSDAEKLLKLNGIIHKYITEEVLKIIKEEKEKNTLAVCIDGAALYESEIDKICDFVIAVIADKDTRLQRIIKRDNITVQDAKKRIDIQKDDLWYIQKAKYTIINNTNKEDIKKSVEAILKSENLI